MFECVSTPNQYTKECRHHRLQIMMEEKKLCSIIQKNSATLNTVLSNLYYLPILKFYLNEKIVRGNLSTKLFHVKYLNEI